MVSHIRRLIIALLILSFMILSACSIGNFPAVESSSEEESSTTEDTTSSQRQPAEPTRSESEPNPPAVTSPPQAPPSATPTQTQEVSTDGDIYFVTDEFDAVVYFIPNEWNEYHASPWLEDGHVVGSAISASSDLNAYLNWGAPGVSIYVSRRLDRGYLQMMEEFGNLFAESCDEYLHIWDYENDNHRGRRQRFWRCGGEDGPTLDLVALVSQEDWQAYTAIVVIVWFIPNEYQLNEDVLLNFLVIPENLP
jgi:hypothetical protein